MRELLPETWAGFAQLHKAAIGAGELDSAIKELIALAISVVEGAMSVLPPMPAGRLGTAPPANRLPKLWG